MKYPAYVPAAVRAYITPLIDGDEWEPQGLAASLAAVEQHLFEIKQAIKEAIKNTSWEEDRYLTYLRQEERNAGSCRDVLADDLDCLRRLLHDGRMRDAYVLLTREFDHDKQWRGFIHSAWAARIDYGHFRDRLDQATELIRKIADDAEKLATSILELSKIGVNGPAEFFSVASLLRKTDNVEFDRHNFYTWRAMRKQILGDPKKQKSDSREQELRPNDQYELALPPSESDRFIKVRDITIPLLKIHFVKPGETVEVDPAAELRYGWEKAPSFPALLQTLADVGRKFTPTEDPFISAAIGSQKRNSTSEYLRGFAALLIREHKFNITAPVMRGMAIVATVVMGDRDSDVTYDDARKALLRVKETLPLEDFGEK
jgi:hypothetical protein